MLLSILTGGGLLGGLALLVLRPALRQVLVDLIGSIPPRVLWALLAMAAIFGAVWWHGFAVQRAFDRGQEAGKMVRDTYWKGQIAEWREVGRLWKSAYEAKSRTAAILIGERYAQDLRRNAALADDLRLRGPGRAGACSGPGSIANVAGGAGRQDGSPAPADAPTGPMPAGDGQAIVPWGWLVQRAEEHDRLLAEVTAWRSHDDQQRLIHQDAIKRLRGEYPEPQFGKAD